VIVASKETESSLDLSDWRIIAQIRMTLRQPAEVTSCSYQLEFATANDTQYSKPVNDLGGWQYVDIKYPDRVGEPMERNVSPLNPPPTELLKRSKEKMGWLHFRLFHISKSDLDSGRLRFNVVTPHGINGCTKKGTEVSAEYYNGGDFEISRR
jgi:hypothetical protein